MWLSDKWQDFELLDCSNGEKLERWGKLYPRAPGPAGHMGHAADAIARWQQLRLADIPAARPAAGAWDKRRLPASMADKLRGAHAST